MKFTKNVASMTAIAAAAMLMSTAASAQDAEFVNPEWANKAYYVGAAIGQSKSNINDADVIRSLTQPGVVVNSYQSDEKDTAFKLFAGKQLNRFFSVEAGIFNLGTHSFNTNSTTNGSAGGTAGANMRYRGATLDLITQVPFTERFSAYTRLGVAYTIAKTDYTGNRSVFLADNEEKTAGAHVGLGMEYKFSEALAMRGEYERTRADDGIRTKANLDLLSLGLVYKLGRPAAAPVVYTPPPAAPEVVPEVAPAPAPMPAPAPAPAPVPTSEKVSFAAEALFDFDKAVVKSEGKAALDDLLNKLQGMNTEVMVTVGHTDSVGSDKYNQKLSMRRAEAVKAYIVSKGVDASRVYTEGKGESQPMADNKTAAGRAKNRRVTVEVVGTRTTN
jgi:OOP family OmpA-OmpF porin